MCGIAGTLGKKEHTSKLIDKMVDIITHRGPDDRGTLITDSFAFGMRRLSIIDLSHGHQPIWNEDETVCVVFNGEIYNYRELRPELISLGHKFKTESDTEGLVHLYEQYGRDMLMKLRGMFGFCIYDKKKNELFIARDHFGIKPIYYRVDSVYNKSKKVYEQKFVSFGSEIKSLLEDAAYKPIINDEAVLNYLSFQYNPLEETMFKDIYKLPPGHYMKVNLADGTFKISEYWRYTFHDTFENSEKKLKEGNIVEDKLAKDIKQIVEDSVQHHMISDVPVGSFLSGGVDSGIIVSTMQAQRKKMGQPTVSTFTIGFDHVSEHNEARQVSDAQKTDHTEVKVNFDTYFNELPKIAWHFDEPVADPSAVALYFLAKEARKKVKVVLSGEGADELFGGYNIYREPFATHVIDRLPNFVKKYILKPLAKLPFEIYGLNYIKRSLIPLEERYIGNANIFKENEIRRLYKGSIPKRINMSPYFSTVSEQSDSRKMQHIDMNFWLPGDILAKADKMTMAHSLELRVPFLDIEVSKISAMIPDTLKYKDGTTKYILRKAFQSILPKETAGRKKLGFPTPIRNWLKERPEDIKNIIVENPYIQSQFNVEYIDTLISDHVKGKRDTSRKVYVLLMFSLWYNAFIAEK
ncbi:MAG: asparagine synthase (glutamine-hydrolyzing) [Candidatus Taylorbacteria bacterium]|nr:asparagine synthase (glutamine-hydrolyzing) [Candidatus Taylorbacteria bacterium]